jgi:hypothetical protein
MKYRVLVAGMAALAIGTLALADPPTPLHLDPDLGLAAAPPAGDVLAQAYPGPPPYPPAPPPPPQAETLPPAPSRPMYGSPVIGIGTACNIIGSREGTSPSRLRPRPIRRDIGSNARRAGCGSAASGVMAPNGREGEVRSSV